MIEWIVTAWLVVGPASGPMTYGFTDRAACDVRRETLLASEVPLFVGLCERGDDKEYRLRQLGLLPESVGKPSRGYKQYILDRSRSTR